MYFLEIHGSRSLRGGNRKDCKIILLKNKSIFDLFVLSEWLKSMESWQCKSLSRISNGWLKALRRDIAPKSNVATKSKECSWSPQESAGHVVMFRLHRLTPPQPGLVEKQLMKSKMSIIHSELSVWLRCQTKGIWAPDSLSSFGQAFGLLWIFICSTRRKLPHQTWAFQTDHISKTPWSLSAFS